MSLGTYVRRTLRHWTGPRHGPGLNRVERFLVLLAAATASLLLWVPQAIHPLVLGGILLVAGLPLGLALGTGERALGSRAAFWCAVTAWFLAVVPLVGRATRILEEDRALMPEDLSLLVLFPLAAGGHFLLFFLGVEGGLAWSGSLEQEDQEDRGAGGGP